MSHAQYTWSSYYNHMIVMIIIHQLFLLKVGVITDVTREGDRNKVSSWGSGREFIGRFIVNINLGATQAETKAVIFHSSSLFMDPSKNRLHQILLQPHLLSRKTKKFQVIFSGHTILPSLLLAHSVHMSLIKLKTACCLLNAGSYRIVFYCDTIYDLP